MSEPARDETAWLIEETWSGYVHYVHGDFDCVKWATECRNDAWRRRFGLHARMRVPIVTKNIEAAKRFPTKDAADLWLALQPRWMSTGDQYQVREHMWPLSAPTASPADRPARPRDAIDPALAGRPSREEVASLDEALEICRLYHDFVDIMQDGPDDSDEAMALGRLAEAERRYRTILSLFPGGRQEIEGVSVSQSASALCGAPSGSEPSARVKP